MKLHGSGTRTLTYSGLSTISGSFNIKSAHLWPRIWVTLVWSQIMCVCPSCSDAAHQPLHGAGQIIHPKHLYEPDIADSDDYTSQFTSSTSRFSSEFDEEEISSRGSSPGPCHQLCLNMPVKGASPQADEIFDFSCFSASRCDLSALIGRSDYSRHIDWIQVG